MSELSSSNENVEKSIKLHNDESNLECENKCDINEIMCDGFIREELESQFVEDDEIRIASLNERKTTEKSKSQIPSKSPQIINFGINDSMTGRSIHELLDYR